VLIPFACDQQERRLDIADAANRSDRIGGYAETRFELPEEKRRQQAARLPKPNRYSVGDGIFER